MALLSNAAAGSAILAQDLLASVVAQSYLMSGTTPSTSANLTLTYGAQEAVVNNGTLAQYTKLAAGTLAITASRDAYIDLGYSGTYNGGTPNGTLTKTEVANGAGAPAVASNSIRLWKVVTSGTAITAVTLLATSKPVGPSMLPLNGSPTSPPAVVGVDSSNVADLSGSSTAATASAGINGATPSQVAGYMQVYVTHNGTRTLVKIPYYLP